ncbi:hypothetical protein S101446_01815 [Komagataeibacter europaeus]|nr:hypothetical protein S101446_01815 [Komagataeibacter europaeus]
MTMQHRARPRVMGIDLAMQQGFRTGPVARGQGPARRIDAYDPVRPQQPLVAARPRDGQVAIGQADADIARRGGYPAETVHAPPRRNDLFHRAAVRSGRKHCFVHYAAHPRATGARSIIILRCWSNAAVLR